MYYIKTKSGVVMPSATLPKNCDIYELVGNTIQDVCNAFVVVDGDQVAELHDFKLAKNTKGEVYGVVNCIDDEGNEQTKTIAKLNSEGELELL